LTKGKLWPIEDERKLRSGLLPEQGILEFWRLVLVVNTQSKPFVKKLVRPKIIERRSRNNGISTGSYFF